VGEAGLPTWPADPDPGAPPELINTMVPEMATPDGPMFTKLPPASSVSSIPAWITTLCPALMYTVLLAFSEYADPTEMAWFDPTFSA
jgi:hypothetical protein